MFRLILLLWLLPAAAFAQLTAWNTDVMTVDDMERKRVPDAQRLTVTTDNGLVNVHYLSRFLDYPCWITYSFRKQQLVRSLVLYKLASNRTQPSIPPADATKRLADLFGPPRTTAPNERYWSAGNRTLVLQMWSDTTHTIQFEKK